MDRKHLMNGPGLEGAFPPSLGFVRSAGLALPYPLDSYCVLGGGSAVAWQSGLVGWQMRGC